MMYRLKDHERQKQLDQLSDGDFTVKFNKEIDRLSNCNRGYNYTTDCVFVVFGSPMSADI